MTHLRSHALVESVRRSFVEGKKKEELFVDYKFGPLTTRRRNLALKKRRELLNNGTVTQAHVAYPARLLGKSKADKRYRLNKDFSKTNVRLDTK